MNLSIDKIYVSSNRNIDDVLKLGHPLAPLSDLLLITSDRTDRSFFLNVHGKSFWQLHSN